MKDKEEKKLEKTFSQLCCGLAGPLRRGTCNMKHTLEPFRICTQLRRQIMRFYLQIHQYSDQK